MPRRSTQLPVSILAAVVAAVALDLWFFRMGPLVGLLGLATTKHVLIAWLCQIMDAQADHEEPRPRLNPNPPAPSPDPARPILAPDINSASLWAASHDATNAS